MQKNRVYRLPLLLAIALHVLVFTLLFVHFVVPKRTPIAQPSVAIVKAVVVNQAQVDNEIHRVKAEQQRKRTQEAARVRRLQQAALAAKQRRRAEEKRLVQLKTAQAQRKRQRLAAAAKAKQQRAVKAAIARKRRKRALALEQKKAALKQKQRLAALKRKQQKARKAQMEASIQQQLSAEQSERRLAAKARQLQGVVDKYKAQITQAIGQQWIIPDGTSKKLSCQLLIQLAPGGAVLNVQVARTSGDAVLDRSAKAAVYKASPLPVPKEATAFDRFRQLRLTVRPEEILSMM